MDTSVLIDGFRLRDAAAPQGDVSAFMGDLLLADTDRIEVLRGSGSSLYGTHATGGVINIITAASDPGFHGEVGAEGGGLGLFRGLVKASGSALDQKLRFSLGATHLNVTRGIDGNDRARNSLVHGLVQYRLGSNTEASARILANDSFAQLNTTPFLDANLKVVPAPDDPDSRRAGGYFSGLFAVSHQWSSGASTRVSYQGVTTRRDNRNGPAGVSFQPEFNTSDEFDGRLDTIQARRTYSSREIGSRPDMSGNVRISTTSPGQGMRASGSTRRVMRYSRRTNCSCSTADCRFPCRDGCRASNSIAHGSAMTRPYTARPHCSRRPEP